MTHRDRSAYIYLTEEEEEIYKNNGDTEVTKCTMKNAMLIERDKMRDMFKEMKKTL